MFVQIGFTGLLWRQTGFMSIWGHILIVQGIYSVGPHAQTLGEGVRYIYMTGPAFKELLWQREKDKYTDISLINRHFITTIVCGKYYDSAVIWKITNRTAFKNHFSSSKIPLFCNDHWSTYLLLKCKYSSPESQSLGTEGDSSAWFPERVGIGKRLKRLRRQTSLNLAFCQWLCAHPVGRFYVPNCFSYWIVKKLCMC